MASSSNLLYIINGLAYLYGSSVYVCRYVVWGGGLSGLVDDFLMIGCRLTQVVLEKRPLNGRSSCSSYLLTYLLQGSRSIQLLHACDFEPMPRVVPSLDPHLLV